MERVGVRELRQHASRYLELVKGGATVEVTERGRLVALLVPPAPAVSVRERLLAEGRLLPRSGPPGPLVPPRPVTATEQTGAVLDDLRGDG